MQKNSKHIHIEKKHQNKRSLNKKTIGKRWKSANNTKTQENTRIIMKTQKYNTKTQEHAWIIMKTQEYGQNKSKTTKIK